MNRRKKLVVAAICMIAVVTVGVLVLSLFNGPAKGTIKTPEQVTAQRGTLDIASKQLQGEYFRLVHSASYAGSANTTSSNPRALEQRTLLKELNPGYERIVITILAMEPGGLAEESSYQLRLLKPEQYTRADETLGWHAVVLFTSADQSEVVAFLTDKSRIATVAVTSTDSSAGLGALARELVRSFEWL